MEKISEKSEKEKKIERVLGEYRDIMEAGRIIEVTFTQQDYDKGLWAYDRNVKITMDNAELSEGRYNYLKYDALKRSFSVKVKEIDTENYEVKVSFKDAKNEVRPRMIQQIDAALKEHQRIEVPARVRWLSNDGEESAFCYLDILGLDINGILRRSEWAHEQTNDLRDVTRQGDVISVVITGHSKKSTASAPRYTCSRKATLKNTRVEDTWRNIEERFPLLSNVVVRCIERRTEYFIGRIVGVEDAPTAYCLFPEKDREVLIGKGRYYSGFVKSVDSKKRIFRIKITGEMPESYKAR